MATTAADKFNAENNAPKRYFKFYKGRKEDTPWNQDLNWKNTISREKQEAEERRQRLEKRKAQIAARRAKLQAAGKAGAGTTGMLVGGETLAYDEYEDEYGRISTRLYDPVRGFSPSGAFQPEREVPPHTSSKGQARHVTHASTHSRIFPTAEAAAAAAAVTSTPASAHGTPASAAHSVRMVDGGAPSPGPAAGGGPQGKGLSRWTKRRPFGEPLPASDIPTPATCNRLRRRVERAKLAQAASKERVRRKRLEEQAEILKAEAERLKQQQRNQGVTWKARKLPNYGAY